MKVSPASRPSPAMVVAAIALTIGLAGSAAAGPSAVNSKLDKKEVRQVKRIAKKQANKRISRRESRLNVNSAKTADDATNLGGESKGVYLTRVAQGSHGFEDEMALPAATATEIISPVRITIPAGVNFVRVDARATISDGPDGYIIWFSQDAPCDLSGLGYDNRPVGETATQDTLTQQLVVPVTPGEHAFRLCALSFQASLAGSRSLIVETIPRGATGG